MSFYYPFLSILYSFGDIPAIAKFEDEPYPEMFMERMQFEYENENGVKTKFSYALAGKRSEDHFYEHMIYGGNDEETEFSDFRKAIDYCNLKEE